MDIEKLAMEENKRSPGANSSHTLKSSSHMNTAASVFFMKR